ncbi:hypothetical protein B0H10DRAFT_1851675 [Mycena sp. CBHHK59/15]|nr:hypothetical protein B0H10DRAFT_1851675 [Mycena sp. CBHHK59/15]
MYVHSTVAFRPKVHGVSPVTSIFHWLRCSNVDRSRHWLGNVHSANQPAHGCARPRSLSLRAQELAKGHPKTHGAREEVRQELGLPPSQVSIWKIDCWSVHKSKEFLAWMKKNHPNIIVLFVPGSCTGIWQPLEVSIQRLLKLSMNMKWSAHRDLVDEATQQINAGKATHKIRFDTTMPTLRNWSVGWIIQAIQDVGDLMTITRVR